jgi:N-carbamoyl-L-amino-acid hydrolase
MTAVATAVPAERIAAAVQGERLWQRLMAMARYGETAGGGVNRQALSPEDIAARGQLIGWARARGFRVFGDAIGNLFVRREGTDPSLPPVVSGSHLDSQPAGGRFDGAFGVLAAFECLEAFDDLGLVHRHPIEMVAWTNEEGSRFAPGAMGSMVYSGALPLDRALDATDATGMSARDALAAVSAATVDIEPRKLGTPISAYLEAHIEQGPILEAAGLPIGVVTGIQGARWFEITVEGATAHAGTTPLASRRDAFQAAHRIIAALNEALADPAGPTGPTRLTIGRFELEPGSVNSVPALARFSIDLRHPDSGQLQALAVRVEEIAATLAAPCTAACKPLLTIPARRFPDRVVDLVAGASQSLRLASMRLPSGAFHDAQFIAELCPTGMIFIPSRDGLSHNEAEYSSPEEIFTGARVLAVALAELAASIESSWKA